jgi:hypothetical protein
LTDLGPLAVGSALADDTYRRKAVGKDGKRRQLTAAGRRRDVTRETTA